MTRAAGDQTRERVLQRVCPLPLSHGISFSQILGTNSIAKSAIYISSPNLSEPSGEG